MIANPTKVLAKLSLALVFFTCTGYAQTESGPATSTDSGTSEQVNISTGFFVSDAGHLVTALHAIADKAELSVLLPGRRRLRAEVLRTDALNDLALLKIAAITPYLYMSHSDNVPPGMDVVTIGYPQVMIQGLTPKITRGIVNSAAGLKDDPASFQFSAEIQRGNSGGPLIGPGGTVVGVVRSKLDALKLSKRTNDLAQNVNFATKSSKVLPLVKGIPGIPTTRSVDPDAPMRAARIYSELKDAIVPVIAQNPATDKSN
jgi:serine protease Do